MNILFWFSIVWHFIMETIKGEQCFQTVQLYYESSRSVYDMFRAFRSTYAKPNWPTERIIRNTITHFDNGPHPIRSEENIATVAENVHEDHGNWKRTKYRLFEN